MVRKRVSENGRTKKDDADEEKENGRGSAKEAVLREAIKEKLTDLKEDVLREMAQHLDPDILLERLWGKAQVQADTWLMEDKTNKPVHERQKQQSSIMGKTFMARNSELTDLLKIKHIATIYNVFVAILITLFISTIIHDVINTGSVNMGIQLLSWNFSGFHISVLLWIQMMALVIGLYYVYVLWAKLRSTIEPKSSLRDALDKSALTLLVLFFVIHIGLPSTQIQVMKLPFASAFAVLMEQIRLLMKTYAFVRTNVPRTLHHQATPAQPYFVPSFDKYLYFLFAPTLLYRDEYPRTSHIRWGFALARFAEVFCITLYVAFIAERYMLPTMRDFGKPGIPFLYIIAMVIDNSLPAITGMVCIFYAILHAWLNGTAELLRYSDRMFYRDWWNTTNYAEYYKTWNIVVYDWLYTFIYKDAGGIIFENRWAKAILVILVSSVFHDYIMTIGLGFFIPTFIVIYGIGGSFVMQLTSSNRTIGNVWVWFTLCLGSGLMITTYMAEYYARINCPRIIESPIWDFVIPRMATCPYAS